MKYTAAKLKSKDRVTSDMLSRDGRNIATVVLIQDLVSLLRIVSIAGLFMKPISINF